MKSQILRYFQSGISKIHECTNAIFIGQTGPRSIFPKPPSPNDIYGAWQSLRPQATRMTFEVMMTLHSFK